ncbi:MAG: elongation factor P, partial [Thermotoga sp.]
MIEVGSLKKGMFIVYEGEIYKVIEASKHFMGRGSGLIRTKLKNVKTGLVREVNFPSGEKIPEAELSFKKAQYLYNDGDHYYFMDLSDYEQYALPEEEIGDAKWYLTENLELDLVFFEDKPIGIELPNVVVLEVKE